MTQSTSYNFIDTLYKYSNVHVTCSLLLCAYFISQCRNKFNLFDTFCIHSRNVFIHFLFSMSIFNPMGPKRKNFFFILICANKRNQIYFYFHLKVKYSEYCLENNFSSITKYDWMLLKKEKHVCYSSRKKYVTSILNFILVLWSF